MTDTTADWAKHAAAEGAAVSADPGESGDVVDAGGAAGVTPQAASAGTDAQVEAAERAPHHQVTD